MQQYWCDALYMQSITKPISACSGLVYVDNAAPLLRISFSDIKGMEHIASPPGFISPCDFIGLKEQIAALFEIHAVTSFLQYRGYEDAPIIEEFLSSILKGGQFLLQKRVRVCVDLQFENDQLIALCRKDTRSRVRQILKEGYTYSSEYSDQFADLYQSIAQKNSFSKSYFYDEGALKQISKAKGIYNISVKTRGGEYVGGAVLGHVCNQEADYILSAYDDTYPNAGRAVLWGAILEARALGYQRLNLGGGVCDGDSLYDYKKSFGGYDVPFYTIKIIFDEGLYRDSYGVVGDISMEGRFPV